MTVIAYDGKTISIDSGCSSGGVMSKMVKWRRLQDGTIITGCGVTAQLAQLFHWYESGANPDTFPTFEERVHEEWSILVVVKNGRILTYEQTPYPFEMTSKIQGWGSGRDIALGAMHAGASSRRAAMIACKLEGFCAPPVTTFAVGWRRRGR